jgi:hypothetical protein
VAPRVPPIRDAPGLLTPIRVACEKRCSLARWKYSSNGPSSSSSRTTSSSLLREKTSGLFLWTQHREGVHQSLRSNEQTYRCASGGLGYPRVRRPTLGLERPVPDEGQYHGWPCHREGVHLSLGSNAVANKVQAVLRRAGISKAWTTHLLRGLSPSKAINVGWPSLASLLRGRWSPTSNTFEKSYYRRTSYAETSPSNAKLSFEVVIRLNETHLI